MHKKGNSDMQGKRELQTRFPLLSEFVKAVSFEDCTEIFGSFEDMLETTVSGHGKIRNMVSRSLQDEAREFSVKFPAENSDARQQAFWNLGANVAHLDHINRVLNGLECWKPENDR